MKSEETDYISLQEATKYCNHSQEYLSLRVRQGKLKAVKFGRNWVVKKEWIKDYLKKVEAYNRNSRDKKITTKKVAAPPKNLPVADYQFQPSDIKLPVSKFKFALSLVIVFVLLILIAGLIFAPQQFKEVMGGLYEDAPPFFTNIVLQIANISALFKE